LPRYASTRKRDLGEGVEGDADRQQDIDGELGREHRIQIGGEEAGIFEDAEDDEIAPNADDQRRTSCRGPQLALDQEIADRVVERDGCDQERHKLPVADRIKGQRGHPQEDHGREPADAATDEHAEQDGRQEQEDEAVGIEQHFG
jgi:hypothetical protein